MTHAIEVKWGRRALGVGWSRHIRIVSPPSRDRGIIQGATTLYCSGVFKISIPGCFSLFFSLVVLPSCLSLCLGQLLIKDVLEEGVMLVVRDDPLWMHVLQNGRQHHILLRVHIIVKKHHRSSVHMLILFWYVLSLPNFS